VKHTSLLHYSAMYIIIWLSHMNQCQCSFDALAS